MPSVYPGSIPTYSPPPATQDLVQTHPDRHIQHQEDIVAIATENGVSPSGSFSSVRARLDAGQTADDLVVFTPAAATDASTAPGGNIWITLGNVTVPTWATKAYVVMTGAGIHSITASSTYLLKSRIGSISSGSITIANWTAISDRRSFTWSSRITGIATGVQSVTVHAERNAGSGQARADTLSRFDAFIMFRP